MSLIADIEISKVLLNESKILPTWDNIINHYRAEEDKISDSIIGFLGIQENALALTKTKISRDIEGENIYKDFVIALIMTEDINNVIFNVILKSVPYRFSNLQFDKLPEPKVLLLIENNILSFNADYFTKLKDSYNGLHINYLEHFKSEFIKSISSYELDNSDVFNLLKSSKITIQEKNILLENIKESLFSSEQDSLKIIGDLIISDNSFRVSASILKLIIVNKKLSTEQRIKLFNWKQNQIETDYFDTFLNSLNEPYSDITINGKRPLINNTNYNLNLIEIIKNKNYISSYDIENKGIRVSTFRKNNELT